MARISPVQLHPDAVDTAGISVATAARSATDSRYGTAYSSGLAAAVPVHFHPLASGRYVWTYARRWYDATADPVAPGAYSSFSADTAPGWAMLDVPSGFSSPVSGSYTVPIATTHDSAVLTDAVSRAQNYLYLLYSTMTGTTTAGTVAHWAYNTTTTSLTSVAEEVVPTGYARPDAVAMADWVDHTHVVSGTGTQYWTAIDRQANGDPVVFDRGLWLQDTHLVVFGHSPTTHRLYMARKLWGRIGVLTQQRTVTNVADDPTWTYWNGSGWVSDPTLVAPVAAADGAPLTTYGPVSVATYQDRVWLATVAADSLTITQDRSAHIWTRRGTRDWTRVGQVDLGSTITNSYLGDTLRFQQQLLPVPTDPVSKANITGIPYVYATLADTGDASTLVNTWGLWPVPRVG